MKILERPARAASEVGIARRRRALLVLAVTSLMVVPVAISWACGPNRGVQLDRHDYFPGQSVTISGANWIEGVNVQVTLNGNFVTGVTTNSTGNFSASFAAPSAAGSYTVVADGVDPSTGNSLPGGNTRQTFTVTARQAASSPGANAPGAAPRPRGNSPAGGTTSGGVGNRGRSGGNSRTVSGGERRSSGGGERARSGAGAPSGAGGPVNASEEGLIKSAGATAFAGSVTRQARVKAATGGASRSKSKAAARPSERSAAADLWSGLASGKNPSLAAGANDGQAPSTAKGAGLALALGLLGVGFLTLLGLGVAEAQRRRSRASAR